MDQRYEAALERARQGKSLEEIFPELAESEDERIRKELISQVEKSGHHPSDKARWIAWLEKQKINAEGDFGRGYDCGYQAGYAVAMNEMKPKVATATLDSEKQKEQKPSLCDKCDKKSTCLDVKYDNSKAVEQCINFVEMEQKSAEWKPQPESLEALMYAIEGKWNMIPPTSYLSRRLEDLYEGLVNTFNVDESLLTELPKVASRAYTAEDIEELRTLKDKIEASMEQKPSWSEEDERNIRNLESILYYDKKLPEKTRVELGNFLKSLRPSWKPSEEQKYDGNMDKECIKLCDILNSIPSIDTFESCCGHLKNRYSIWFFCNDIITISRLGRCVERNYSDGKWELLVDSTDTHPIGVFWLRSKVPFQSYGEMEESVNNLCNCIQHWFDTKFDSYFNGNTCK